jgi:hypothetical protein
MGESPMMTSLALFERSKLVNIPELLSFVNISCPCPGDMKNFFMVENLQKPLVPNRFLTCSLHAAEYFMRS